MPRFTTPIPATGSAANIYAIMGTACRFMRELAIPQADISKFTERVMQAESYREAVDVVREWFPVDLEEEV